MASNTVIAIDDLVTISKKSSPLSRALACAPRGARAVLNVAIADHALRPVVDRDDWLELRKGRRVVAAIDLRDVRWPRALRVFLRARDLVDAGRCGDLAEVLA